MDFRLSTTFTCCFGLVFEMVGTSVRAIAFFTIRHWSLAYRATIVLTFASVLNTYYFSVAI